MRRKSGVLMHVSSLYGDYSIGGFGRAAKEFIDFLCDCRFSYWQVLPFNIPDMYNSPYQSVSAFAGNPFFMDPLKFYEEGFVTKEKLNAQLQITPYTVEYDRLRKNRLPFLFEIFKAHADCSEIERFLNDNPQIKDFCDFMGRKKANSNLPWRAFDENDVDYEEYLFWGFLQKRFYSDWIEIKWYANERGIRIIGDMPIYVSYESADVWKNPELFLLDENNVPLCVAGVPPDYFCEDGQLWGNPLYNWNKMKENDYAWWVDRIKFMSVYFDQIRIDHFRGLSSFYATPFGAENAKAGKWMKGPGESLISKMNCICDKSFYIAEDLGELDEEVKDLLDYSGYKGIRVLQFGFLSDEDNIHLPHNYNKNIVSYTGTHDNNTLLGYIWELDDKRRKHLFSYCGYQGDDLTIGFDSIIRTLFQSHADTVILPIQDLLQFGSDTRMNTPGTLKGNWMYRITKEQLMQIDREKYKSLNRIYRREGNHT